MDSGVRLLAFFSKFVSLEECRGFRRSRRRQSVEFLLAQTAGFGGVEGRGLRGGKGRRRIGGSIGCCVSVNDMPGLSDCLFFSLV